MSTTVAPVTPEAEATVTTTPSGGSAAPAGAGLGQTEACDRLTPAELSAAFGVTFEDGTEITGGQCLFDSDGSPRLLLAIYTGSPTACEMLGADLETVEIAGNPGWWDQAGAQARVCLPDGSIAVILSGGGGDNSIHRDALLALLATSASR